MNVCVLATPMVTAFQEAALERVAALDGVRIERVVVDSSARDSALAAGTDAVNRGTGVSPGDIALFADVVREDGLKAFIYADQKLGWTAFGETKQLDWLKSTPVESVDCLSDATVSECEPVSAGGAWNTLPTDATDELERTCDVAIRFGFGLLKGRVLEAPKHGVLSAHGSDIRKYRGMGPKLSFLYDDTTVSVTLQRLTEEIDGGSVVEIRSHELPAQPTLDDVWDAVYTIQTEIFAAGIERLKDDEFTPWNPEELGPYYPHSLQRSDIRFVARLLAKNNWRRLRKRFA